MSLQTAGSAGAEWRVGSRRQLTTTRRRWVLGTLVVAMLALAGGASQGLASASGKGTQQAPVQLHNDNCGVDTGQPQIGHARFTLSSSGKMRISFKVDGADPGAYRLELWTGDGSCERIADVSKFNGRFERERLEGQPDAL